MSQKVLYFSHSTLVLSFYIDVVLTFSIRAFNKLKFKRWGRVNRWQIRNMEWARNFFTNKRGVLGSNKYCRLFNMLWNFVWQKARSGDACYIEGLLVCILRYNTEVDSYDSWCSCNPICQGIRGIGINKTSSFLIYNFVVDIFKHQWT